jgi:hypothetical protein
MAKEGMSLGSHNQWKNPHAEKLLSQRDDEMSWEDQIEKAERGELVDRIIKDKEILDDIKHSGFPDDEEVCDQIGERHGLGAAEIAALSKRLRKKNEEKIH